MAKTSIVPAVKTANPSRLSGLMAALDLVEEAEGSIVGGCEPLRRVGLALEREIIDTRAATFAQVAWKLQRLQRADANGWTKKAATPLVGSIQADFAALQGRWG